MIDYNNISLTVEQVGELLRSLDHEIKRNESIISELPVDDGHETVDEHTLTCRRIRTECLKSVDRLNTVKRKFEQDYERRKV